MRWSVGKTLRCILVSGGQRLSLAAILIGCHASTTPPTPTPDGAITDASSDAITIGDPVPDLLDGSPVIYGEVDVSKLGKECTSSSNCKKNEACSHYPNVGYRCSTASV
mgnify:CR=1 FL=1